MIACALRSSANAAGANAASRRGAYNFVTLEVPFPPPALPLSSPTPNCVDSETEECSFSRSDCLRAEP